MRNLIHKATSAITSPDINIRNTATTVDADQTNHTAYLETWPCFQTIELVQPPTVVPEPEILNIVAWNLERCKRVEESAALLKHVKADVVLATEMDIGMARSAQRHTPKDLARELGFGYAFGVEFVELGTGDSYETGLFSGIKNEHGLHGNAILSRFPLISPKIIPLDDNGLWYTSAPKDDGQRRVGGRMAITAQIKCGFGTLSLAAVHYESESDPSYRASQTQEFLEGFASAYGSEAAIIGGDLNTAALSGELIDTCLYKPQTHEPCFSLYENAGFDWQSTNTGSPTTRAAPGKPVNYPLTRLDWLFCRGVTTQGAAVYPAICSRGHYLSDHELIAVQVTR